MKLSFKVSELCCVVTSPIRALCCAALVNWNLCKSMCSCSLAVHLNSKPNLMRVHELRVMNRICGYKEVKLSSHCPSLRAERGAFKKITKDLKAYTYPKVAQHNFTLLCTRGSHLTWFRYHCRSIHVQVRRDPRRSWRTNTINASGVPGQSWRK